MSPASRLAGPSNRRAPVNSLLGSDAFHDTALAEHLRSLGVTQAVLAGIATSVGVESTARSAHEHGFNVTLATDAMTDVNPDAQANSISRIFPRLGETGTAADIIARLDGR